MEVIQLGRLLPPLFRETEHLSQGSPSHWDHDFDRRVTEFSGERVFTWLAMEVLPRRPNKPIPRRPTLPGVYNPEFTLGPSNEAEDSFKLLAGWPHKRLSL